MLRDGIKERKGEGLLKVISLSLPCSLHRKERFLFVPQRSNQGTYKLLTPMKVVPFDIPYILPEFEPNLTEGLSP